MYTPRPPSLYSLALQQCLRYSSFIEDVGDLPYMLVKPILARLPREQLAALEARSPHIAAQSDELWREFIMREFRDRTVPKANFRETFHRYCREKEEQLVAARARLRLKQEQLNKSKRLASVITLSEQELPPNQRGNSSSFKSRHMQSVARRAHASAHMRRAGPSLALSAGLRSFTRPAPKPTATPLSTTHSNQNFPSSSHTNQGCSPPQPNVPPRAPGEAAHTPPPPHTPSSQGAQPQGVPRPHDRPALRPPPMKRRKVPSVFIQRK